MKKCKLCLKANDDHNKYCIYCGRKFIIEEDKKTVQLDYDSVLYSDYGVSIAFLAKVAYVRGHVTILKTTLLRSMIEGYISSQKVDSKNLDKVEQLFQEIIKEEKNKVYNINRLASKVSNNYEFKTSLINALLTLAYVDGTMPPKQEDLIIEIVHALSFDFSLYKEMRNGFEPYREQKYQKQSNENNSSYREQSTPIENNYTILGLTSSESNEEIKKSYRKLVREYHTDFLSSKNLPKDMIAFAEEKLKMINSAYEAIKKERGI